MSARNVRLSNVLVLAGWLAAAVAFAGVVAGCQKSGPASPRQAKGTTFAKATPQDVIAARLQAAAAADTYVTIVAQAADELRTKTARPEVALWAMEQRIAAASASFTNATGINGYVGLLDMMVLSTLKQRAVKNHWIPTLLHEEGEPLLESYRRGERDVWALGAKVLSEKQLAELRQIIDDWQEANPTQYYVAYIRFTDFANSMRITSDSPKAKSSVFGLLYMDPLAGLDPVARELQEVRGVSERLSYLANRMPIILSWHVDLAVWRATHDPQVSRFVDNTSKFVDHTSRFADATTRFSAAVVKFPQDLAAERTAAIAQLETATTRQIKAALDQTFGGVNEQRLALAQDLNVQQAKLEGTVDKLRGVVQGLGQAGTSIRNATDQTVDDAEQSSRRVLNHLFLLAVAFVVITLMSLLAYRATLKRWARGAVAAATTIALLNCAGCIYDSRPEVSEEKLIERRCVADVENAAATSEIIEKIVVRTKSQHDEFTTGRRTAPPVIDFLIISGGGDWGAFGAGFLKGWGRVAGKDPLARPEFDVVTGVSTGSLIAPFAFVGDEASIDRVVHLYRNPRKDWVRRRGMLYFLPSNASFAEVPGLERELRAALTPDFVRRIAEAGGDGRVLAVNTTNVDDGVPRVFDIVLEARQATDNSTGDAKKDTKRLHEILLASCGIPAAFPFRVIDAELYVDGGVTGNIIYGGRISEENSLAARWTSAYPDVAMPKLRYWVIFNNWIRPHPQVTPPNWPAVVSRSLEMGTRAATLTSMRHLFAMAEISRLKHNADVEVRVVAVPETWTPPKPGVFVKETMNDLADLGERMGADPASWKTTPP